MTGGVVDRVDRLKGFHSDDLRENLKLITRFA